MNLFFDFERYNNFLGFSDNKEYLDDYFDTFNSQKKLRQVFLNLSSNILSKESSFSKYEQSFLSNYSLKLAFIYKIKQSLPISYIKPFKIYSKKFNFDLHSTLIINSYKNNIPIKNIFVPKRRLLKSARLIFTCFLHGKFELLINKDLLFHQFVLKKLRNLHKDKEVVDCGDSIFIKSKKFYGVKIYTSWKKIETSKPNIKDELDDAIRSVKKGESYQIFLAYPKHSTFKKQIPVYVDELKKHEYQIKVIPYSMRSIIR